MSQITFPQFTNMQPIAEDFQLIIDSLRTEVKNRLTVDGIFNPGIVGEQSDYLSYGSQVNTIKIKPFVAYTQKGNRIEIESTFDKLSPQGTIIPITEDNIVNTYLNIPVWSSYSFDYLNYLKDQQVFETSFTITKLGKGSILHGIKLRTTSLFLTDEQGTNNVTVSIGTDSEPNKFLPETLVSVSDSATDLSVMNLMYSIDDDRETDIKITFRSDSYTLSELINGALKVNLCIANLSGYDNTALSTVSGGYNLSTGTPNWTPSITYYIVARYKEDESDFRYLQYKDANGNLITTNPEAARIKTNYQLYALRKNGSIIDASTLNDVKIGEVQVDSSGKIYNININGYNSNSEPYTQYLTIPGFRLVKNISAEQIGDGTVTNTQFAYLNTLTSNVQTQLNTKAQLDVDNIFTGNNTFTQQINGDIKTVNGYTAYTTPMANSLLVLDNNGKIPASAISESTLNSIANVYTVSSGKTTNGRSSYISANTGKTGVILSASSNEPLVFNYPDGSTEKLTANKEITGGIDAKGYYYLVKEKNGNFIFLPTAGGTIGAITSITTTNTFIYNNQQGTVSKPQYYSEGAAAFNAFDGTLNTGAQLGKVKYTYFNNEETFIGYPLSNSTFLQVDFPVAITPTAFAACFRIEGQEVCTPKDWLFQGSNDNWSTATDLISSQNTSWNKNEIKTFDINGASTYNSFRFIFNVTSTTINNYVAGEETTIQGVTIPIKCYYFQIYTTNTDTVNKKYITEGYTFPSAPTIGSYFLDISKKPFVGYKATGMSGNDAWTKIQFIKLGFIEVTEDQGTANRQVNVYPFCYNTFTISTDDTFARDDNNIPLNRLAANTPITFNHNLGVIPNVIDIKFECIEGINGYTAGTIINNIWTKDTQGLRSVKSIIDSNLLNIMIYPCALGDSFYLIDNDSGSLTYKKLTTTDGTKWKVVFYCARGW